MWRCKVSQSKGFLLILALFAFAGTGCQRVALTVVPATATAVTNADAPEAPCTEASLKAQLPRVQRYFASVESQILETMPDIPGMRPYDWRSMLERQSREEGFYVYGAPLWLKSEPEDMTNLSIHCNVMCQSQLSTAAISPTLSISDSRLDMRIDWFINTGLSWLDEEIQRIVQAAYETDFRPDAVP